MYWYEEWVVRFLHDAVMFLNTMVLLVVVSPRSISRMLLNGKDTTEVLLIFAMISPIITCSWRNA